MIIIVIITVIAILIIIIMLTIIKMSPCGLLNLVVLLGLADLEFPRIKLFKNRLRGQVRAFYSNTLANTGETLQEQHHPGFFLTLKGHDENVTNSKLLLLNLIKPVKYSLGHTCVEEIHEKVKKLTVL